MPLVVRTKLCSNL
jgi:hypothetical protein